MRFVFGVLLVCFAVAWATGQSETDYNPPAPPTTMLIGSFDADIVVIPFPDKATTLTFALTDPDAPDPISLRFEYPTTETLAAWMGEVQTAVAGRMAEAEQGVRGMGGDASLDAIKSVYRDEIAAQENIEGMLQHYLNAVVKVRFRLELLRRMAAAQTQNAG